MTVKELIRQLQELSEQAEIFYYDSHTCNDYYLHDITQSNDGNEVYINIH